MNDASENKPENHKKHICAGLLAHVDAGKTTLAESILYLSGSIRQMGRVDHQNAFLDTYELERSRGITIFSKQAKFLLGDIEVALLDTPGHVDFSAEMERTLQILDYAILVISGADGVQGHVQTLWRLLKHYRIPVFLFVNKMDQNGVERDKILGELKEKLDERCLDFGETQDQEEFMENLAMCDETALERYLETGRITSRETAKLISERKVFPCYFGSALKIKGVDKLLSGLEEYMVCPFYPEEFGAKVYKISRDPQGNRLTHMKLTGGCLKVKDLLAGGEDGSGVRWEEKVDQIRIYSGAGYETVSKVKAGSVCAVTGLGRTYSGQGLGIESASEAPLLEPVLTYQILLPEGCDVHGMFLKLRQLEEEEPELHIVWEKSTDEIRAQVMGEIQIEILKSMIQERFGIEVSFGEGSIVYKETLETRVEGIGHFEPLRHYAEVHLLLEPLEPGAGLVFDTVCSEDMLDRNWQRLVLTHLREKVHKGVLTGSEITDMKITLVAGKAHQKHTEGGDFREATYRAVRQGLMSGRSILLEPVYEFRLEVPADKVGRALSDIQKMYGSFSPPELEEGSAVILGSAPVSAMGGYQREVIAYTRGSGRLFCSLKGYEPCHNAEEVIASIGYEPEADLENPTGSVFCSHGAGFVVPWDQVPEYMHVDGGWRLKEEKKEEYPPELSVSSGSGFRESWQNEKELEEIFVRTFGPIKREKNAWNRNHVPSGAGEKERRPRKPDSQKEYLLVDGYNIIFAWDELKELAEVNIEGARNKLMDILCNYQGYKKNTLILVFDAYKVEGNQGEVLKYHNIHVVYTKEAETADQYIEKVAHEIGRKHQVTVATSDALEQVIILGQGAARLSAAGLREEIQAANIEIRNTYMGTHKGNKNYLFDHLTEDMAELMEDVRLGRKTLDE